MHPSMSVQAVSEELLKQSRNVYVASLPLTFDDQRLQELFTPYGRIVSARIMRAKRSHASKGYGFVMYREIHSAEKAIEALNGCVIGGSRIQVRRANADASMQFSKVSHVSLDLENTPPAQINTASSLLPQSTAAAPAPHVMYTAATVPQPPADMYATQTCTTPPFTILPASTFQSQNNAPVPLNQGYCNVAPSTAVFQTPRGSLDSSLISHLLPQGGSPQVALPHFPQQQPQPFYVVLLSGGQQLLSPVQFAF